MLIKYLSMKTFLWMWPSIDGDEYYSSDKFCSSTVVFFFLSSEPMARLGETTYHLKVIFVVIIHKGAG